MKPQDWLKVLTEEVARRGLPKSIGARGWITQSNDFWRGDEFVATGIDGLKGWIFIEREYDEYLEGPAWTDLDRFVEVLTNFVNNNTDGETGLYVGDDTLNLVNEEADGKSWEYESSMDEEELFEYIRETLAENDEPIDLDEDPDVCSFLWDYCEARGGECTHDLSYGVAWVEFDDGFNLGFGTDNTGEVKLIKYGDQDIRDTERDNIVNIDTREGAPWPFTGPEPE